MENVKPEIPFKDAPEKVKLFVKSFMANHPDRDNLYQQALEDGFYDEETNTFCIRDSLIQTLVTRDVEESTDIIKAAGWDI